MFSGEETLLSAMQVDEAQILSSIFHPDSEEGAIKSERDGYRQECTALHIHSKTGVREGGTLITLMAQIAVLFLNPGTG